MPLIIVMDRGGPIIYSYPRVEKKKSTLLSAIIGVAIALMSEFWGEKEKLVIGYADLDLLVKLEKDIAFVLIKPKFVENDIGWRFLDEITQIINRFLKEYGDIIYLNEEDLKTLDMKIKDLISKYYEITRIEWKETMIALPKIKLSDIVALTILGNEFLKKRYDILSRKYIGEMSEECINILKNVDGLSTIKEITEKLGIKDEEVVRDCIKKLERSLLIKPVPNIYAEIIILKKAINLLIHDTVSITGKVAVRGILYEALKENEYNIISLEYIKNSEFTIDYVDNLNLRLLVLDGKVSLETLMNLKLDIIKFWERLIEKTMQLVGKELTKRILLNIQEELGRIYGEEKVRKLLKLAEE